MPRPLVIGNGRLLVALDGALEMRDLTWPWVGLPNHLSGHRCRLGVWADGTFAWVGGPGWEREAAYAEDTLATDCRAYHREMGLHLRLCDCVSHRADVLLRRMEVRSDADDAREVRILLTHDFHIAETDIGDTVFYNPFLDALVHYKRDCYLLMAGEAAGHGLHQYAAGIKGFGGAEGTWRDAEDGQLSMNPVAQGSVDSAFSLRMTVGPGVAAEARAWLCAGATLANVAELHRKVRDGGFDTMARETSRYWASWSRQQTDRVADLPGPLPALVRRSLLVMRANTDHRGAVIAANDSDIMETARAHYSYVWPRDGALAARALDRMGYADLTRRFFQFCRRALPPDRAALMHKYSADGSWGATWHPWTVADGHAEVPFQEDSTALTVWALWQHYECHRDLEFIESLYDELVLPCCDFMVEYRDPATGLPLPSYDLWEERRGVNAYTCGTVYGAFAAAAALSDVFNDGRAQRYRDAAAEVQAGMAERLYDPERGTFARRLVAEPGGGEPPTRDMTVDSALHGVWAFGAFAPDDPRVERTMRSVITRLWVQTDVGGIARYEADYYFRRSDDVTRIPGNPWFICTLWAAQWCIARAHHRRELDTALDLLLWAARHAMPTGVMAEQVHPLTGEALSVAPLTWSHAEFVNAALDYAERRAMLPE